ncbi:MAG: diguanylate cyclase [Desulfuromusa sp.]|nr:diguanylate cyclase [Desulfuromusa sp.]
MIESKVIHIFSDNQGISEIFLNAPSCTYRLAVHETDLSSIDLFIVDLDLSTRNAIDICRELKSSKATSDKPIILLASASDDGDLLNCLNIGVEDYVFKPVSEVELLARADILLRPKNYYEELEHKDLCLLLSLTEAISSTRNPMNILRRIVEKMSTIVDVARCSIVSISGEEELIVKASSDLSPGEEIRLELGKYPEINRALTTKKAVIVNDLKRDVLMESVRQHLEGIKYNSIVVVPIFRQGSVIGTFLLRTASQLPEGISQRIYKLTQMVANISAGALENAILFQSVKNSQQYFEEMSIRDGLTGLYNHRHFHSRLEDEFQRARRHDIDLSCIFLDINNFKSINDEHGHLFGDEILKKISLTIEEVLRETDIAARYGGDEFSILLPNTGIEGTIEVANRLTEKITENMQSNLLKTQITASIGFSVMSEGKPSSAKELLQQADGAMYQAKEIKNSRDANSSCG